MELLTLGIGVSALVAAIAILIIKKNTSERLIKEAESRADRLLSDADKEARRKRSDADREVNELINRTRRNMENEARDKRKQVEQIEQRVTDRERQVEQALDSLKEKEAVIVERIEKTRELRTRQEEVLQTLLTHLENVAKMTKEEAESTLMVNVEREVRSRAGKMIKDIEEQARKVANRKAKEIVLDAIQRTAVDHVTTSTTAVVALPDEEMKGRIIGREGRNIRAFEAATGVDVIIDDTPNGVVLSAFDPIRRETARLAMESLITDGRIHPTRVEEAVDRARKELQEIIVQRGERAADELGLQFHPKLIEMMGKLHYRTSYGQNILAHSLETAHIAGIMAAELGVNVKLAKRGGMLHDIGKAIDFEQEGSHDDLGAEACKKYGESDELINCIMAHHEDQDPDTVEAVLVMVADAISSARPGARKESVELYVKRLENLEKIASSFDGVEKAFAIQAGREIRVLVRPEMVDDLGMKKIAMDIAKKIEDEVDYPGEVKVSLVRETRVTSIAK